MECVTEAIRLVLDASVTLFFSNSFTQWTTERDRELFVGYLQIQSSVDSRLETSQKDNVGLQMDSHRLQLFHLKIIYIQRELHRPPGNLGVLPRRKNLDE
jgi:hypothetical protein